MRRISIPLIAGMFSFLAAAGAEQPAKKDSLKARIQTATADLAGSEALLEEASATIVANKLLFKQGAISRAELSQSEILAAKLQFEVALKSLWLKGIQAQAKAREVTEKLIRPIIP